mgnify:CR=1 FL=1
MNNKNALSATLYVILFVSLFILIQSLSFEGGRHLVNLLGGTEATDGDDLMEDGKILAITAVISSLATFILFISTKWAPVSGNYLKTRPWGVFMWSALIALGSILPMQFLAEKINLTIPEGTEEMFKSIMKVSWGYVALGLMVPFAEEIVFRGAIQRILQNALGERNRWIAIVISALIFGIIHFNLAQGLHAFLVGLLLGWLYSKTGSILPGFVFHWMNNTVAYLMFNLMPQMNDGKLIDFFHGNDHMMYGGLFFSLCIFIPSLLQLIGRMPKGNK